MSAALSIAILQISIHSPLDDPNHDTPSIVIPRDHVVDIVITPEITMADDDIRSVPRVRSFLLYENETV
jgi:hypothetical protein